MSPEEKASVICKPYALTRFSTTSREVKHATVALGAADLGYSQSPQPLVEFREKFFRRPVQPLGRLIWLKNRGRFLVYLVVIFNQEGHL